MDGLYTNFVITNMIAVRTFLASLPVCQHVSEPPDETVLNALFYVLTIGFFRRNRSEKCDIDQREVVENGLLTDDVGKLAIASSGC